MSFMFSNKHLPLQTACPVSFLCNSSLDWPKFILLTLNQYRKIIITLGLFPVNWLSSAQLLVPECSYLFLFLNSDDHAIPLQPNIFLQRKWWTLIHFCGFFLSSFCGWFLVLQRFFGGSFSVLHLYIHILYTHVCPFSKLSPLTFSPCPFTDINVTFKKR